MIDCLSIIFFIVKIKEMIIIIKEKTSGIYKIENLVNSKVYIGSSKDIYKRWKEHKKKLLNNNHHSQHLQKSWNKYGENNFQFDIIEECLDIYLIEREQYWMDYYNCYHRDYGYNILPKAGSLKGNIISNETKKKMSESQKLRWTDELREEWSIKYSGSNNPFYNKTHSEEFRIKNSKNKKGKYIGSKNYNAILNEENVKEIKILLLKNELSHYEIAYKYNISESLIDKISENKVWKHVIVDGFLELIYQKHIIKPVVQLDLNNNLIRQFDSIYMVEKLTGIVAGSITKCCKGIQKTSCGFKWMYLEDYNKKIN